MKHGELPELRRTKTNTSTNTVVNECHFVIAKMELVCVIIFSFFPPQAKMQFFIYNGVNTPLSAVVKRDNAFLAKLYRKPDFFKSL
jgi:hypothetical protein